MENEQFKSVLQLERLSFEEISYLRKTDVAISNIEYEMNFTRQISMSEDEKHFRVLLTANVWSKANDAIKLKVTLVGYFVCECDNPDLKNQLIAYNTVSILFPYIRSQISLVTTQPDLPPVTLPPVNIVSLFQETEQQE